MSHGVVTVLAVIQALRSTAMGELGVLNDTRKLGHPNIPATKHIWLKYIRWTKTDKNIYKL